MDGTGDDAAPEKKRRGKEARKERKAAAAASAAALRAQRGPAAHAGGQGDSSSSGGGGDVLVAGGDEVIDDFASEWERAKADGTKWGGRGRGGRGVARQQAGMSSGVKDVHIPAITLAVGGTELLHECPLRLVHGRRYALLGRNGVGKSSLLHRMASNRIPGFPPHLRVALVAQEEARAPPSGKSALEWLVALLSSSLAATLEAERGNLEEEMEALELASAGGAGTDSEAAERAHRCAARLGELEAEEEELRGPRLRRDAEVLAREREGRARERRARERKHESKAGVCVCVCVCVLGTHGI
jgi:hypothetical protein